MSERKCSCGAHMLYAKVWSCIRCDLMLEWPTVEHSAGVIALASLLGVGRLPRDAS